MRFLLKRSHRKPPNSTKRTAAALGRTRPRAWWRALGVRLLSVALVLLQVCVLIAGLLWLAWRLDASRAWLTDVAARIVGQQLDQHVAFGTIEGTAPWNSRIPWVRVAEGDALWLEARDLRFKADWRAALRGEWVMEAIHIERIDIARWPHHRPPPRSASRDTPPSEWTPFALRQFRIGQLSLPAPEAAAKISLQGSITGERRLIAFDGAIDLNWLNAQGTLRGRAGWTPQGPKSDDLTLELALMDGARLPWPGVPAFSNLTARANMRGGDTKPLAVTVQAAAAPWGRLAGQAEQQLPRPATVPDRNAWRHHPWWFALEMTPQSDVLPAKLARMAPPPWHAEGVVRWEDEVRRLSLHDARWRSPALNADLNAVLGLGLSPLHFDARIQGNWAAEPELVLASGVDLIDLLRFDAHLRQDAVALQTDFQVETPAVLTDLRIADPDLSLRSPMLQLHATRRHDDPAVWIETHFEALDAQRQPIRSRVDARFGDETLALDRIEIGWGDAQVQATGAWRRVGGDIEVQGRVTAPLDAWRLWPAGWAEDATPTGQVEARFELAGMPASNQWSAGFDALLTEATFHGQTLDLALATLQFERGRYGDRIRGRLDAFDADVGGDTLEIDRAGIAFGLDGGVVEWALDWEGAIRHHPLVMAAEGGLSRDAKRWNVAALRLHTPQLRLESLDVLAIRREPDVWVIPHPGRWRVNDQAELQVSGWIAPGVRMLDVDVAFSGEVRPGDWLPEAVDIPWGIQTDSRLHLWGPFQAPRARFDSLVVWDEPSGRRLVRQAIAGVSGGLDTDGAWAEVDISAGDGGMLSLSGTVPLTEAGGNGGWTWREAHDARATARGEMDLGWLLSTWTPDLLRLTGNSAIDLDMAWHPGSIPRMEGTLSASELNLDVPQWGVLMRDGQIDAIAEPDRPLRFNGVLRDVLDNALTIAGGLDWSTPQTPELELRFESPRFVPMRTESVTITTALALSLSGRPGDLLLGGEVRLIEAAMSGMPALPLNVPRLEVEDIDTGHPVFEPEPKPDLTLFDPPAPELRPNPGMQLDLWFVTTPESLFNSPDARMRWQGALHLKGPVNALEFQGRLSLLRGHVSLLGRRLNLTEGELLFSGEPIPELEIVAESRSGGVIAQILISGPANQPHFRVMSDPPMAEDEILAYILFRRGLARIGPYQAYQLAQVLRRLHGGAAGGGLDLLGHGRRLLPVDEIDIVYTGDIDDEEAAAIQIGRYVGSRFYLAGAQGVQEGTGRVSAELELTRHLSLETEIRADMRTGLGLNWKWDY